MQCDVLGLKNTRNLAEIKHTDLRNKGRLASLETRDNATQIVFIVLLARLPTRTTTQIAARIPPHLYTAIIHQRNRMRTIARDSLEIVSMGPGCLSATMLHRVRACVRVRLYSRRT